MRFLARFGAPIAFNIAMCLRAFQRPFEYPRRAPRIDGGHGRAPIAKQGIANSGIEEPIIAGNGFNWLRYHAAVGVDAKRAPMIWRLFAPIC